MAQWSRADRTLYAKLVYYGPAFGGKTTNLEALHRITDPRGTHKLLSVKTANDRTLFFDLMPFELGDILGYKVAMKLYTVPGQVRYDTTRQVVLGGADAVVFVADSSSDRREQNTWSLQNLQMNMRAKRLDPGRVPILYQFNKQDLPTAAPPRVVARWLGISASIAQPSVALRGDGVLETFMKASRAMLERIVALADSRTRKHIDGERLGEHLDRAFAPYVQRLEEQDPTDGEPRTKRSQNPIVLQGEDLLERSVQTSVELGEKLSVETERAVRLEREADAFRRLSESLHRVGATFDRERIIDGALDAVADVMETVAVAVIHEPIPGELAVDRICGLDADPLLSFEEGRRLLKRVIAAGGPCVVDELIAECEGADGEGALDELRAAAAVPIDSSGTRRTLIAYAPRPDGVFNQQDVRFLATVASHLRAGLEKARLHDAVARHRDKLERAVGTRTEELRKALDDLRRIDQTKDRFLNSLSREMQSPLTSILSAAKVVRDYDSSPQERGELVSSIITSAEMLNQQLEQIFRLVNIEDVSTPLELREHPVQGLVEHAIQLSERPGIQFKLEQVAALACFDRDALANALANLIDNAVKFSPSSSLVRVVARPATITAEGRSLDAIAFSVYDRGPGVPEEDRERIFAPFEQGGSSLNKPRGIGIGLHEAASIARRHCGHLEHLPREEGGSEFRLTVPLQPMDAAVAVLETTRA